MWMIASDENLEHLKHYGVPGMEWGVRNYLDETGHLTAAGRERYRTSSGKYVQSSGLKKRKQNIENLRTTIKGLSDKKGNKAEKKKAQEALKAARLSYREDSKAERANYNALKKQEREDMKQERENLKEVNRYVQYNKGMAKSIERMNKFTKLIGRYNGRSEEQVKAGEQELANKAQAHRNEAENTRNMDIRKATSSDNISRFQAAMKNFKKRRT